MSEKVNSHRLSEGAAGGASVDVFGRDRERRPRLLFWLVFVSVFLLTGALTAILSPGGLNHFTSKFQAGRTGFLIPSSETVLNGFVQIASQQSASSYRVNFRGRSHHSATVALTEARGDDQGKCVTALQNVKADESTIPFQLSAGHGVVFTHSTALLHGGQIGWMQLLFDDQGSCLEISAKGLAGGELEPQDLILMLSSLRREPRS